MGTHTLSLSSQSSRTQGSLTTLTPPSEVSPGPGDSPVHSGPHMQPLIPGVPSSSRGRPTDFSVLQGTRPGLERKPEACPSTARAQGLGQGAESGVPQECSCCPAGTSTQGKEACSREAQLGRHRCNTGRLSAQRRACSGGPRSPGPSGNVPRALDPMPTRTEWD